MKTRAGCFRRRPWLLVVLAFALLIAAWIVTIWISAGNPHQKLTPEQEAAVLAGAQREDSP